MTMKPPIQSGAPPRMPVRRRGYARRGYAGYAGRGGSICPLLRQARRPLPTEKSCSQWAAGPVPVVAGQPSRSRSEVPL